MLRNWWCSGDVNVQCTAALLHRCTLARWTMCNYTPIMVQQKTDVPVCRLCQWQWHWWNGNKDLVLGKAISWVRRRRRQRKKKAAQKKGPKEEFLKTDPKAALFKTAFWQKNEATMSEIFICYLSKSKIGLTGCLYVRCILWAVYWYFTSAKYRYGVMSPDATIVWQSRCISFTYDYSHCIHMLMVNMYTYIYIWIYLDIHISHTGICRSTIMHIRTDAIYKQSELQYRSGWYAYVPVILFRL